MADVQQQFEKFHQEIRVDYEMSQALRDKRDILVKKIRKHLQREGKTLPEVLLQGSYKMKTGVKPIDGREYDIDIGLRFSFESSEHEAVTVRGWVYDAVKDHTKRVEDKGSCIRVCYEEGYHLDLVSYAVWTESGRDQYRLAHKSRGWIEADPPALLEHVKDARKPFKGTEDVSTSTDQFRRSVRYLRRWDDVQVSGEGDDKPSGLAFVLLMRDKLQPTMSWKGAPCDLRALETVARSCAGNLSRISSFKSTPEYEDMFARLSDEDMLALKKRFGILASALSSADADADPVSACETLQDQFGEDFPVPAAEETAKKTSAPAIITTSSSA